MQLAFDLGGGQPPPPSGNGRIVYLAYRDAGAEMRPVATGGRLVVFDDLETARAAAGVLGVGSPTDRARLPQLCRQYGLQVPGNGGG